MLEKVCRHVHNYFTRVPHVDTYTIENGMLALDFLKDGQRFHIVGSDLNDGVYTWHQSSAQSGAPYIANDDDTAAVTLQDEVFAGTILPMAVPKMFLQLVEEIGAWVDQYGEKTLSPFQSENVIGVYSYTKAGTGDNKSNGRSASPTWESVFAAQLRPFMRTGDLL